MSTQSKESQSHKRLSLKKHQAVGNMTEDNEDDVMKDDEDHQDYSVTTAVESKKGEGFYFD